MRKYYRQRQNERMTARHRNTHIEQQDIISRGLVGSPADNEESFNKFLDLDRNPDHRLFLVPCHTLQKFRKSLFMTFE